MRLTIIQISYINLFFFCLFVFKSILIQVLINFVNINFAIQLKPSMLKEYNVCNAMTAKLHVNMYCMYVYTFLKRITTYLHVS